MTENGLSNRNLLLFCLVYLIIGTGFVFFRQIYSDEGYYIWSARNIFYGEVIYRDFLFHHLPLLPFIYAPFSDLGFSSYFILRFISVLCTMLLVILIYKHVLKATGAYKAASFAAVLMIFNGMYADLSSIIKMYALTNLFCYFSFYLITSVKFDLSFKDRIMLFAAGLTISIASNSRIIYYACVFVLLIYVFYESRSKLISQKSVLINCVYFLSGVLIPAAFSMYFILNYYEFWSFGNFKHNFYAEQTKWANDLNTLLWIKFFFLPQNFILMVLLLYSLTRKFTGKVLAVSILAAMLVGNAAGYYVNEYLTMLIPFVVYIVAVNYDVIRERNRFKKHSLMKYVIVAYILGFFISVPHFRHKLQGKILEPDLISLKEMVDYERTLKGEKICSSWYVYSLFSQKKNDILKNDYIYGCMVGKPSKEETNKFSLPDSVLLNRLITEKYFDVIVLNENTPYALTEHINAIKENYKLEKVFGNTEYFIK